MPKGYWISAYRTVSDADRLTAYGALAAPAIAAGGGRYLVRGGEVTAYDQGVAGRTVVIEFDSYQEALAARESAAYQEALTVLGDAVERDFRVVEGVEGPQD